MSVSCRHPAPVVFGCVELSLNMLPVNMFQPGKDWYQVMSNPERENPERESSESDGPSAVSAAPSGLWRWVSVLALVVALCATGVAVWALNRPAPQTDTPAASAEEIAQAKVQACGAFETVRRAVSLRTNASLGAEPVAVEAVAANARLAMATGGAYLLEHLDPATPSELGAKLRSFGLNLQEIAVNTLAGVPNDDPAQAARLRAGEDASKSIAELCK